MNKPAAVLDPSLYTVVPHTCMVDSFQMTNEDGTFVADINESFIDRLVAHMNDREAQTGDLAPYVIGHTPNEPYREEDGPPLIGYVRNWSKDLWKGKAAAFADVWIFNGDVERARRFPRRSCEVWVDRYEVDPVSALGATTPARDLGLLKLSATGGMKVVIESPGELNVPDFPPKTDKPTDDGKPAADPKQSGDYKGLEGKLDQILQLLQQLLPGGATGAPAADAGAAPQGAPPAGGEGDGSGEMSDAELEQLLSEMGGEGGAEGAAPEGAPAGDDKSRKGDEPVKNNAGCGYPGGSNTNVPEMGEKVKLSRIESDLAKATAALARRDVKDALRDMVGRGRDVNPDDEEMISDLVSLPEDMRNRQLQRVEKLSRPRPGTAPGGMLQSALEHALPVGDDGKKRIRSKDEQVNVIKLARQKNIRFEDAAAELGYVL